MQIKSYLFLFLGEASKGECHSVKEGSGLLLHRAFSVLLWNGEGELLVQRRSDTKITYPGHLTNTCCSHPLRQIAEETLEDPPGWGVKLAAIRRLNYELGIPTSQVICNQICTHQFKNVLNIHIYVEGALFEYLIYFFS